MMLSVCIFHIRPVCVLKISWPGGYLCLGSHSPWGTFSLFTFTWTFEFILFHPFIKPKYELALILEEPKSKEKCLRTLAF